MRKRIGNAAGSEILSARQAHTRDLLADHDVRRDAVLETTRDTKKHDDVRLITARPRLK